MTTKRLRILAFADINLRDQIGEYTCQVAPENWLHMRRSSLGAEDHSCSRIEPKTFASQHPQEVTCTLTLDSTGVAPGITNVTAEIEQFRALAYAYNGAIHRPNYLMLDRGSLKFNCVLSSLNIAYELFSPDGTPLRASLKATFRHHQTAAELAKQATFTSPGLTHL